MTNNEFIAFQLLVEQSAKTHLETKKCMSYQDQEKMQMHVANLADVKLLIHLHLGCQSMGHKGQYCDDWIISDYTQLWLRAQVLAAQSASLSQETPSQGRDPYKNSCGLDIEYYDLVGTVALCLYVLQVQQEGIVQPATVYLEMSTAVEDNHSVLFTHEGSRGNSRSGSGNGGELDWRSGRSRSPDSRDRDGGGDGRNGGNGDSRDQDGSSNCSGARTCTGAAAGPIWVLISTGLPNTAAFMAWVTARRSSRGPVRMRVIWGIMVIGMFREGLRP
ncbi:uncharacterized protein C8Q71DRAFT_725627 [Rhodofomes roseus]|uniref:Uncharacterized protein n=1 Tax=Rhodofomes roseus TaxID=34475 RepID=A0ABQ8K7U2_9APHY|nr:uncharacterized protein C8Q71DRAFT_725627 [Rhodofomes roseus]KAH9833378.1 hypothetical protein C8Q71DRAFT_725627 [Rhodofomes roseus]